jgi:hypothetical protein
VRFGICGSRPLSGSHSGALIAQARDMQPQIRPSVDELQPVLHPIPRRLDAAPVDRPCMRAARVLRSQASTRARGSFAVRVSAQAVRAHHFGTVGAGLAWSIQRGVLLNKGVLQRHQPIPSSAGANACLVLPPLVIPLKTTSARPLRCLLLYSTPLATRRAEVASSEARRRPSTEQPSAAPRSTSRALLCHRVLAHAATHRARPCPRPRISAALCAE